MFINQWRFAVNQYKSFNEIAASDSEDVFIYADFAAHFSEGFINETPCGSLNNKLEEIHGLTDLAPSHVESVAPKGNIFTYSCEVATLSFVKKLTIKDAGILYVRRTIVHQLINKKGKWYQSRKLLYNKSF